MADQTTEEQHDVVMHRFLDLANEIVDEGVPVNVVASALMVGNCVYSIYALAGNEGVLNENGMDQLVDAFRRQLEQIQQAKRDMYPEAGQAPA